MDIGTVGSETSKYDIDWRDSTVSEVIRRVRPITFSTTIGAAVEQVRLSGFSELPVLSGARLVGVITLAQLTYIVEYVGDPEVVKEMALGDVIQSLGARGWDIPQRREYIASANAPMSEVQAVFRARTEYLTIPVVTDSGTLVGIVTRADLAAVRLMTLAPPKMGGMATPIGVYLTDGLHYGGAGDFGLFLTGVTLAIRGIIANVAIMAAVVFLASRYRIDLPSMVSTRYGELAGQLAVDLESLIMLPLVMLLIRVTPLAGYHAAEHQVVHAVERGEPLTVDVVRTMPRVHPRCGTNIVAAMALFSISMSLGVIIFKTVLGAIAPALVLTLALWRPLGSLFQQYLTTRPANAKQLQSGIDAATELMLRYRKGAAVAPKLNVRIWRMGIVQTMCGVLATTAVALLIAYFVPWLKPYIPALY
ncbi:MAG TPA: DUF1385 domain-containing protein [Capsulimonadaceae bacterium]